MSPLVSAGFAATIAAALAVAWMRGRRNEESLNDWEKRLDDAYDLGREAGRELYWLDALTMAPEPIDALMAWNPNAEAGAQDASQVMFSRGRYDGWWEAARFDITDTVNLICKDAA